MGQQIAKGFNSWRAFYFEMLALKRSMSFWINRAMGAAWNTWVTWVDDLHRQRMAARNAVLRAVLRWGGSELLAAFGYWRETSEKIRVAELEFRAYLTKSYDPTERSRSRSGSPVRQRGDYM